MSEEIGQKQRWAQAHNKRRRDNYARDPKYRALVNQRNRDNYRKDKDSELRDCRENMRRMREYGTMRLLPEGEMLTFNTKEMADLLGGYHPIVLYRWQKDGKFPRPNVPTAGKQERFVYSEDQARRLMNVLGAHQQEKQYFHGSDTEVIEQLFEAVS